MFFNVFSFTLIYRGQTLPKKAAIMSTGKIEVSTLLKQIGVVVDTQDKVWLKKKDKDEYRPEPLKMKSELSIIEHTDCTICIAPNRPSSNSQLVLPARMYPASIPLSNPSPQPTPQDIDPKNSKRKSRVAARTTLEREKLLKKIAKQKRLKRIADEKSKKDPETSD